MESSPAHVAPAGCDGNTVVGESEVQCVKDSEVGEEERAAKKRAKKQRNKANKRLQGQQPEEEVQEEPQPDDLNAEQEDVTIEKVQDVMKEKVRGTI